MRVTMQAARVYGSKSQYGRAPRLGPCADPITLDGYPNTGERSWILLGAPSDPILQANRLRRAIGRVALSGAFAKTPKRETRREALIEKALHEDRDSPRASDHNWYVTIVIERATDVPDALIAGQKYFWIKPQKAIDMERDFKPYASPQLDVLATYASTIIDWAFFEELVINDQVFFSAPPHETFGLPHFSIGPAHLSVTKSADALNLPELGRRVQAAAELPTKRRLWLGTVARWHVAALTETDPWKRFLWSFVALEVLTHKLFGAVYDEVRKSLHPAASPPSHSDPLRSVILDLIQSKNELSLKQRFKIVASRLHPDSASSDVTEFNRAQKARNGLAHGDLSDVNRLPTNTLRALLGKYLTAGVEFQLQRRVATTPRDTR